MVRQCGRHCVHIAALPGAATIVSRAIGGWHYGHFDIQLNADATIYNLQIVDRCMLVEGCCWVLGAVVIHGVQGFLQCLKKLQVAPQPKLKIFL